MAVERYRLNLLQFEDCPVSLTPEGLVILLRAWRKSHSFQHQCNKCNEPLVFEDNPYTVCCSCFYYNDALTCYPVNSIAIRTPGYTFVLQQLQRMIDQKQLQSNQQYLVFPDPIFWQMSTTLVYEKVLKFVKGLPVTCRTQQVHAPSKAHVFYKQIQEAPLNYGSLDARSCGKATLIRQVAFGKRCVSSMRGMIVPDSSLRPNEIRLPDFIVEKFKLKGKWVILNRMPSLQPENFVSLQVPKQGSWPYDCFGIPLEIVNAINGDFDGDECNVYLVSSFQAQAELSALLNPEWELGCFVMGLKLAPSQDMLVAFHLFYDKIDFLQYKCPDLKKTFQVIYETYGSKAAFDAFDEMRKFYLDMLQRQTHFALTLEEMLQLIQFSDTNFEEFEEKARQTSGCLVSQVLAKAKGSFEHLYQMFGKVGQFIENSFWKGLNPLEAVVHAQTSYDALLETGKIWQPGYGYTKIAYNLHELRVDYLGRLMDGEKRVIEQDVLDVLHHTDVMAEETFQHLIHKVLVEKEPM